MRETSEFYRNANPNPNLAGKPNLALPAATFTDEAIRQAKLTLRSRAASPVTLFVTFVS